MRLAGMGVVILAIVVAITISAGSAAGARAHATAKKPVRIAYLSFAVANSYDAPMLAANLQIPGRHRKDDRRRLGEPGRHRLVRRGRLSLPGRPSNRHDPGGRL